MQVRDARRWADAALERAEAQQVERLRYQSLLPRPRRKRPYGGRRFPRSVVAGAGEHIGDSLKLNRVVMQGLSPRTEPIQATLVGSQAAAELGRDFAQFSNCSPPGSHDLALFGNRCLQSCERTAEPIPTVPRGRCGRTMHEWDDLSGHGATSSVKSAPPTPWNLPLMTMGTDNVASHTFLPCTM